MNSEPSYTPSDVTILLQPDGHQIVIFNRPGDRVARVVRVADIAHLLPEFLSYSDLVRIAWEAS